MSSVSYPVDGSADRVPRGSVKTRTRPAEAAAADTRGLSFSLVQDRAGFAQAQAQYRQTLHELHWLQNGGMTDRARVTRGAQQGATVVSAILSGLALVGLTLSLAS